MAGTRTLGTGAQALEVSAVGLGCMGFSHAYGAATDEDEAVRLIREAADMGYTFFDTAETYGTEDDPHHNERLVGRALADRRDQVVIATKFGIRFDTSSAERPYPLLVDSRPETIRASVEGSLRRLQTDHIDLYYQHRGDPKVPVEEVAGTICELMAEGKVLHWGLSEAGEDEIRRAHAVCPLTAIQNRYSMMARWHETLFPALEELGIGYVAFSPMANGLLTCAYGRSAAEGFDAATDYRASMPQFTQEAYEKNDALFEFLRRIAAERGATTGQISLAWMLEKRPWIVPIPGTRKVERMHENLAAADIRLSLAEVEAIDAELDRIPTSGVFGGTRVEA